MSFIMRTRVAMIGVLSLAAIRPFADPSISQAKQADLSSLCSLDILPKDFQRTLTATFSSWKIQEPSNLTPNARGRWEAEKPLACPGIAVGQFETPGKNSYAVLLVPKNKPDSAYKLLVYAPDLADIRTLDEWNNGQAANYFIHSIVISKVFSKEWIGKLDVTAKDGILSADAGEKEYGVDIYFWTKGQYHHEPIDY